MKYYIYFGKCEPRLKDGRWFMIEFDGNLPEFKRLYLEYHKDNHYIVNTLQSMKDDKIIIDYEFLEIETMYNLISKD
jgi:hypothetical protein